MARKLSDSMASSRVPWCASGRMASGSPRPISAVRRISSCIGRVMKRENVKPIASVTARMASPAMTSFRRSSYRCLNTLHADPRDELAWAEGLGHVVVAADLEAENAVDLFVPRGPEQDRHIRG